MSKLILLFLFAAGMGHACAQPLPGAPKGPAAWAGGFMENNGQLHDQAGRPTPSVKYLLRGPGMNVQLKTNSFSYDTYVVLNQSMPVKAGRAAADRLLKRDSAVCRFHRVDIQLRNANPAPRVVAGSALGYRLRMPAPSDPDGIQVNSYRFVTYKEVYPGIDLVFDAGSAGEATGFEYYFVVKPGADATQIRLEYKGAATGLDKDRIIIQTINGKIAETAPASFVTATREPAPAQLRQGAPVKVTYSREGKGIFGFRIPHYDKTKTLIIDPTPDLAWGTYYGGALNDWAKAIDRDPAGNILVGGASNNPSLATTGAYQVTLTGFGDAMIGKFKADGTLLWITYYGGEWEETVYDIGADPGGNILVAGVTFSKTGIATPGSHQTVHGDAAFGADAFLAKFSPDGARIWATYLGGSDADYLHAVQSDQNGNLFVAGWTQSANAIATPGAFQTAYGSSADPNAQGDGILARFDNNGHRIWATYYGGLAFDRFYDLVLDKNGYLYATGVTSSSGLASPGAYQPQFGGGVNDAWLVKFDLNGARIWSTYYGGNDEDYTQGIACDMEGNIIIAGMTISAAGIATPGAHQPAMVNGLREGFVAKFNPSGGRIWGTYYGGSGEEMIYHVTSDNNNNIVFTGWSYSPDHIATPGAYQSSFVGTGAIWTPFVAKLNKAGQRLWGTYLGYGSIWGNGEGEDVVTDEAGNIFACGETMAPNGIAGCNATQPAWAGAQDMFVVKLTETGSTLAVAVTITADRNTVCAGTPVTFTANVLNGGNNPSFQWQVNGINAGANSPTFTDNTLSDGDKVTCSVTSNLPCVTVPQGTSNTLIITISPAVVPAVTITASATGSICTGTPVTFTAIPVNGGSAPLYQWKVNGNNVGANSISYTTNSLADGDEVTCELTNTGSCSPVTTAIASPVTVKVLAAVTPTISISASVPVACAGTEVLFTAEAFNAGSNPGYQWKVNNVNAGTGPTYSTAGLSGNETIECYLTPDQQICAVAAPIVSNGLKIQIDPLPVFTIEPQQPVLSKGDTIQLKAVGGTAQYKWSPASAISSTTVATPLVWPDQTQTYIVEATSPQQCTYRKQVTVTVITDIYIPTAFTPNNDGRNDHWDIKGLELYPGCTVTVYNRWGEMVYQSVGYPRPWNGSYKGQSSLTATYVYVIRLGNNKKPLSGTVTVVK